MLERFIAYMKANGAWIASCQEVAQYVKDFYVEQKKGELHDELELATK